MPHFQSNLHQQQARVLSAQAGTVLSLTSHECLTICSLLISYYISIIQANFSDIYLVITYVHLLTSLFAFLPVNLYSVPMALSPSPVKAHRAPAASVQSAPGPQPEPEELKQISPWAPLPPTAALR